VLQTNYTLTGGSLGIHCLINSTLSYHPPTAAGFPCPVSTPPNAATGNCSGMLLAGATCNLRPADGFTLASGSLTLACSLGQLSRYPTFVAAVLPVAFVNPPSTFQLGSGGVLELLVSSAPNSAPLQYTWSYISMSDQAAGLPPVVLPMTTNPLLQLDPSLLLPDTKYNVSVRVVNTMGGAGFSSTVVQVLPVDQPVQVAVGTDPCSSNPAFQCLNGGRCVATETASGSGTYTLSCACARSPIQFFGASCGFALLECPNGNALYAGGTDIALYGIGFSTLRRIAVAGRVVPFERDMAINSSSISGGEWQTVLSRWPIYADRVQRVRFAAPALVTINHTTPSTAAVSPRTLLSTSSAEEGTANPPAAYQLLTLNSFLLADSTTGRLLEANFSNLLYYSSSTCRAEGQWKEDGVGGCLSCPQGAFWSVVGKQQQQCLF
jgi:hypothetical protein